MDREGRIHAVAYVVHDSRCAYWLLAGSDPARRDSGAGTLLVDARPADQFGGSAGAQRRRGHIPGPVSHPWKSDLEQRDRDVRLAAAVEPSSTRTRSRYRVPRTAAQSNASSARAPERSCRYSSVAS